MFPDLKKLFDNRCKVASIKRLRAFRSCNSNFKIKKIRRKILLSQDLFTNNLSIFNIILMIGESLMFQKFLPNYISEGFN